MLCIHQPALKTDEAILAYAYLKSIGAIIVKADAPPHKVKSPKIPKGRIGWKRYNPANNGGCGQCGGSSDRGLEGGGHSSLCADCFKVLERSRRYGVANDDFPSAG